MIPSLLTKFQTEILALATDGLSNRQIAEKVSRPFACIISTLGYIKRKGVKLPEYRPLDATAENALRLKRNREAIGPSRFTAKGTKPSTGEKFTVTSDSQAHSDDWLAYMVGAGGSPIGSIHNYSQNLEKFTPRRGGPKGTYAPKTKIDHADVFRLHGKGMTTATIGAHFGVRPGTINRILKRRQHDV